MGTGSWRSMPVFGGVCPPSLGATRCDELFGGERLATVSKVHGPGSSRGRRWWQKVTVALLCAVERGEGGME